MREISRLAEDELADRFRGIDGVAIVNVNGALRRELSVLLRAEKLREFDVSVTEVVERAARAEHHRAGRARCAARSRTRASGWSAASSRRPSSSRSWSSAAASEIVRLGQVATVEDGFAELAGFSRAQRPPQRRPVGHRSRDASTVAVANEVRELVAEINKTLPKGTKLEVTQDGGKDAQNSLNNVIDALVFGAGLTIFVVYAVPQLVALDADHRAVACRPR